MPPAPVAQGAPGRVRVFGGVLATDRSLPGLPVAPSSGDGQLPLWELRTDDHLALPITHSSRASIVGRLEYSGGVTVTLARRDAVTEILVSDTGRFDLTASEAQITHHAPPDVDRAAVALDVIGVVLPYALHCDGAWCMHASAVNTPAGVIAFVATRGTGKSTLATACVQAGCALVADDVVVLRRTASGISVTPAGVPLRLRADTARAIGVTSDHTDDWGKVRVSGTIAQDPLPLAAIYVLQPMRADADISRVPRTMRAAALAILAHGKITSLLGGESGGEALSRCVEIAHDAEVYDLAIPRDLDRLTDVTEQLFSWHANMPVSAGRVP